MAVGGRLLFLLLLLLLLRLAGFAWGSRGTVSFLRAGEGGRRGRMGVKVMASQGDFVHGTGGSSRQTGLSSGVLGQQREEACRVG
jgi:hypothetical protein